MRKINPEHGPNGRYRQPAELGEDVIGGFGPHEGLGVVVVLLEVTVDGGLEVGGGPEDAAPDALTGEFGEEAFDSIEPGAGFWGEVEGPTGMPVEPSLHLGMLVTGVIVDDGMDPLTGRDRALNGIEEADEFLVAVSLHAAAQDDAIECIVDSIRIISSGSTDGRPIAL